MNSLTLNEIAYSLLNELREGRSSNSDYLDLDHIKFLIKYYRSLFIRRDEWRNNNNLDLFEQDLGLVEIEQIDTAESNIYDSFNFMYKTSKSIPTPVRLKTKPAITFIGGIDRSGKPIPLVNKERNYWEQFNKYTAESERAFYRNGYVYLETNSFTDVINIRGVFEDPEDVFYFQKDSGIDLYDGNELFPISSDMIQNITQGLLNGELKIAVSSEADDITDNQQGD